MLVVHSHNNSLFLSLLSLFPAHRQETWQKATNQSQHRSCYYVSLESAPLNSGRKVLARLICRVKVPHPSERLLDKWDLTAVFLTGELERGNSAAVPQTKTTQTQHLISHEKYSQLLPSIWDLCGTLHGGWSGERQAWRRQAKPWMDKVSLCLQQRTKTSCQLMEKLHWQLQHTTHTNYLPLKTVSRFGKILRQNYISVTEKANNGIWRLLNGG